MEAAIRCSALGDDLSAPKTPTIHTCTQHATKPPAARLAPENRQPRANTQVQKLQTLTRCFKPYAFRGGSLYLGVIRVGAYYNFLPPNYFPSGGFGFRLYCPRLAAASCCVFTLWHGGQTAIRFSGELLPPLATFSMWSTSVASCVHPLYRNPHW